MALEESIDKLTASIDKLIALGGVGSGAAAGKAAAGKPAKPKHTADQVKAKFQELRANEAVGAPPLKELISGLGAEDLAALLATPALFDQAMAGLLEIEAAIPAAADDDL